MNDQIMKKNITFKAWLAVFFGGIGQFIRNIFSWRRKTPFWRVIWITNAICVIAVISMIVAAFYKQSYKRSMYSNYYNTVDYSQQYESDTVVVVEEVEELINE